MNLIIAFALCALASLLCLWQVCRKMDDGDWWWALAWLILQAVHTLIGVKFLADWWMT